MARMSIPDIALLLGAVVLLALGWGRGFLISAGGFAGFVLGMLLAMQLAPIVHGLLGSRLQVEPYVSGAVAAALVVLGGILGGKVLADVGAFIRSRTREDGPARVSDSALGALTSMVAYFLVIWLAAGFVRTTPMLDVNRVVASSSVVAGLDRLAPMTSERVLGAAVEAFGADRFPRVFSGQREIIRGVGEPDPRMTEVGQQVRESVLKVNAGAPACRNDSEGTGWVYRDGLVVTNAHVVAGAEDVSVQIGGVGRPYDAQIVAFDPGRDIAVLRAPDLGVPALPLGERAAVGQDSVVVGYPENGPYTISPSRVRDVMQARGLDIYHRDTVTREIYSLRGIVRPGNSGGPLLDSDGDVIGLVFGRSESDDETGYALTLDEISPVLEDAAEQTAPVSSGACLAA